MIVVDASVAVDMLLGPGSQAGDMLAAKFAAGGAVCAPHLVDAEVGQVIRRFTLSGSLSRTSALQMVADLSALPIRRFPNAVLVERAMELLDNVTVYDGLYIALAEALDCPLLTGDRALMNVPGSRANVEVVTTTG